MRFLIVDDSPTIRLTLKSTVRQAAGPSAEVAEALDAAQAISEFRLNPPDVVFLDMMLANGPGGKDVLAAMLAENPRAKVVLCTGLPADHADVVSGISQGAFAYLPKPVRLDNVKRVLSELEAESGRGRRIK